MLSKAQIKRIQSLKIKKYRQECQMFAVEGDKAVCELLLSPHEQEQIYATLAWSNLREKLLRQTHTDVLIVSDRELKRISSFKQPNGVLALVNMPNFEAEKPLRWSEHSENGWILALDSIRDPGNLGTIIRSADWFGINTIVCSPDCVDVYNPKVIQASMGSLFHIEILICELDELLHNTKLAIAGALLKGDSIYESDLPSSGVLIVGNESAGLKKTLQNQLQMHLTIPSSGSAESLNAAVATAVILSEIRRQNPL